MTPSQVDKEPVDAPPEPVGQVAASRALATDSGRKPHVPDWVWTLGIASGLVALCETIVAMGWISHLILPRPTHVVFALYDGVTRGAVLEHVLSTVGSMLAGFLLGTLFSVVVAGILSSIPRLESILLPFIVTMQTMPKVAVAPLIVVWVGFGENAKILIVFLVCFFPIFIGALHGFRVSERERAELAQSLGASKFQLFRYIRLPGAVPSIFSGLHVGILLALVGAIVAEFVGSSRGLGYLIMSERAYMNTAGMFAWLLVLMLIGLTANRIVTLIEQRLAFWAADTTTAEP